MFPETGIMITSTKGREQNMKTYEIYINREAKTENHTAYTEKFEASPDPKREGMYKLTVSTSSDGYKNKTSRGYGKSKQAGILKFIQKMTEVA